MHAPRPSGDASVPSLGRPRLGVGLRCSAFDIDGSASQPVVQDPHHELIYVERGVVELHLGLQSMTAQQGDAFLLPAGALHISTDLACSTTWILSFRSEAIEGSILPSVMRLLPADEVPHVSLPEPERSRWERRFGYLLDELCAHREDDGSSVRAVLKSILLDMLALARPLGERKALSRRAVLEAVFGYIDAHYRLPITLRDVAAVVHFSPAYLTDLVRRETGRPIHQWISKRRLDAARSLLAETDRPIAEIAEGVGFRDTSYFGRYFSKIIGQTPRSWRATHRRDDSSFFESRLARHPDPVTAALGDHAILYSLAQTCGALTTREDIDSTVADATHELFQPSIVQILQRDEALGTFRISRQRGNLSFELPPALDTEGALPLVLGGHTVVARDLSRSSVELFQRMSNLGICCFMVAPMVAGSRCVGAIRVLETQPRGFSERERSRLATIGALAGLAVRVVLRQRTRSI